jgi:RNA polymerase sigma-70 factor (ECF subfamily)
LNEQALLLSVQQGDQQAFKLLVETWQHMVFNTVLSIVQDTEEAEDLSQEVFIQVYQSIHAFRGEAKLSTWIYRIAVTKALDAERKKKAKKRFAHIKASIGIGERMEEPAHFHHPGVQMDNKELAALLFKALKKLPENQRVAFVLIKTEGQSYQEVADIMNLTVKSVEALMHRAKENLRKILQDYYQEHS